MISRNVKDLVGRKIVSVTYGTRYHPSDSRQVKTLILDDGTKVWYFDGFMWDSPKPTDVPEDEAE